MIWSADFADRVVHQKGTGGFGRDCPRITHTLRDPNWPLKAMGSLGIESRNAFENWKPAFGWWLNKRERLVRKLGLIRENCLKKIARWIADTAAHLWFLRDFFPGKSQKNIEFYINTGCLKYAINNHLQNI